jgi:hypothetical protein
VFFINGAQVAGKDKPFSLVTDLALLRAAIEEIGDVVLVIIDPITSYLGVGKVDSRSGTDVRGVLTPLKNLVEEMHLVLIGILHFNKKEDTKAALLRISDSIAYVAVPRHVYVVLNDPEDQDSKLFVKAKNNVATAAVKGLRYHINAKKVGHDNELGKDIIAPFIAWQGYVDVTANEALQAADGRSGEKLREAKEFLLERLLEGNDVKSDDIYEEAKHLDIAQKTLKRAKKDLGIKSRKSKGQMGGEWLWSLPKRGVGK